uniref:Uncharacterized protein n=1 Tax=Musca domestica TaxID=7370 RepID=A0A1I8N5Z5_MUSDO
MLLAMRRETEHPPPHHHNTAPNGTTVGGGSTPPTVANATTHSTNTHNLSLSTTSNGVHDSLNTPSTPLLNLGRNPLQFTAPPPPPPIAVQSGTQFGFYTPSPTGASTYFHHYTHPAPTTYVTNSSGVLGHPATNGTYGGCAERTSANVHSSSSSSTAPVQEELEEFVDIFQVQHLLLDHSAAAGNQPPPPPPSSHSTAFATPSSSSSNLQTSTTLLTPSTSTGIGASTSSGVSSENLSHTTTTVTTSTAATYTNLAKPQPRPRLNLQKASEYAAQVQADSPSSRRMLLDYPSPYLYGNHYHTSPSEDLVALWFGSNGS